MTDKTGNPSSVKAIFPYALHDRFRRGYLLLTTFPYFIISLVTMLYIGDFVLSTRVESLSNFVLNIIIVTPFMGWIIVGGWFMSAYFVMASDIEMSNRGIKLDLPGPWLTFIPCESLHYIRIFPVKHLIITKFGISVVPSWWGRARWFQKKETAYAISIPGLTFMHRLAGLFYGLRFTPVFIVTRDHHRAKDLMKFLRRLSALSD